MKLFRPVGLKELELIIASGYKTFPPRLPEQPIFYPVMNYEYAEQITREWNVPSPPYAGFVTSFDMDDTYISKFPIKTVGGKIHQELWVPAEELDEFNGHIIGKIEVLSAFYGDQFSEPVSSETNLPIRLS